MDHETALREQLAERYLLNELPADERDAFEEHYFGCPACAEDVRIGTVFRANARVVLREEGSRKPRSGEQGSPGWWYGLRARPWLVFSAALNVALAAVVALQLGWLGRTGAASNSAARPGFYTTIFVPSTFRSETRVRELPRGTRLLGLTFDLQAGERTYPEYTYRVEGASGGMIRSGSLGPLADGGGEVNLAVPLTGLAPGGYSIVFSGLRSGTLTELRLARIRIVE